MNNSYKLFGQIYDRLSESDKIYHVISLNSRILDYTEKYNLFDLKKYIRKINLSKLFSIESIDERKFLIKILKKCDEIVLLIDYELTGEDPITKFIKKRIKQILYLFEGNGINKIILMKNS